MNESETILVGKGCLLNSPNRIENNFFQICKKQLAFALNGSSIFPLFARYNERQNICFESTMVTQRCMHKPVNCLYTGQKYLFLYRANCIP